jgi:hypothetical protein
MNHIQSKTGGKIHRAGQEDGQLTPECDTRPSPAGYVPTLLALNCRNCINKLVRSTSVGPPRLAHPEFFSQDDLSLHFGMSKGWVRVLRSGVGRVPNPVPFPKPDVVTEHKNRAVPLWHRDRIEELEDWYRAHVAALAKERITAMEANARAYRAALKSQRRSA